MSSGVQFNMSFAKAREVAWFLECALENVSALSEGDAAVVAAREIAERIRVRLDDAAL